MSAVVGELLRAAVRGPEPSVSARQLVDAAGGTSAVARAIAGVGNTRPKDMTAEARRRYNAALRRVQRWVTSGAESRCDCAARGRVPLRHYRLLHPAG